MSGKLVGKVAIVTGASSGIGAATARALAQQGAAVTLLARRAHRLEELREELTGIGAQALSAPADVTDRAAVESAVQATVHAFGALDILVNNAGVMFLSSLADGQVEDWDRMIDVNIKGVLYGVAAALPHMLEQGNGHIVNVGSVAGRRPISTATVYAATKFALRAISAGIHLELSAQRGIRVTDIQPGAVSTELADHIRDPAAQEAFRARWVDRRILTSDDIAEAILYAVSAPSRVNVNEILVRPTDQPN